jgi:hypothetical protein
MAVAGMAHLMEPMLQCALQQARCPRSSLISPTIRPQSAPSACSLRRGQVPTAASTLAVPAPNPAQRPSGHTVLLHGLGAVGDVHPSHLPWLLRHAHIRACHLGGDSSKALQVIDLAPEVWLSWRPCKELLPMGMCTLGSYHRLGTRASRNQTM